MAAHLRFRILVGVVVLTIVAGTYSASLWRSSNSGVDFSAYYIAACLVRRNESVHIYDAIDRNTNPQLQLADPKSVFAQAGRARGMPQAVLYLYPPTLADLMVSLTALSPSAALKVWHALEILQIAGLGVVLMRTLKIRFPGSTPLVAAGVLLFRPTMNTIYWGQVSIFVLFVMTIGLALYVKGHKNIAALMFALAVAIKLEPIIIIVPLLAWRDWKCLRSLAVWSALLGLSLWAINGGNALTLYFLHQLPAMAGGDLGGAAFDENRSVGNIFYTLLDGVHPVVSRRALAWIVRVLSVLILCYTGWLSQLKRDEDCADVRKFEIGLIFILFVCCLSPYSWFYNWALSAPAVVMFCRRVWDGKADAVETALLIVLLLALSTSRVGMVLITPLVGVALGSFGLYRMRLEAVGAKVNYLNRVSSPIPQ